MVSKSKKVSTIEGLARLMQTEFLGVHHEFSTVHHELSTVHRRLDVLETGVGKMQESSGELFAKLDEFISLYRDAKQELTVLARQIKRLEERINQLEAGR